MSCPDVGVCFGCVLAGLEACPFRCASTVKPALPLVESEKPRVEHRPKVGNWDRRPKILWMPPGVSLEEAERILDSFYGKRR